MQFTHLCTPSTKGEEKFFNFVERRAKVKYLTGVNDISYNHAVTLYRLWGKALYLLMCHKKKGGSGKIPLHFSVRFDKV